MRREEFYSLPPLVQDYLVYIEAIKGHSELSVIEYASDLRTFFRYLAKSKRLFPSDMDEEDMDLTIIDINFIKFIKLMLLL